MDQKIRLGVSSCLLGSKVRYNGGHSLDRFLTDTLGQYVDFVPVCPEVECGFPVPRDTLRLVGSPSAPRLIVTRTGEDHTDRMVSWARSRVLELEREDLCGFVFKSGSPSSGMERVKVYNDKGMPSATGVGLFARAFMDRFPLFPVEDEGRLHDPKLRENFIEAIFALKRWRETVAPRLTRAGLVEFHSLNKLLLFSHSPRHAREMGKLVAQVSANPMAEGQENYQSLLLQTLKVKTSVKKNTDVLFHVMGFFKKFLSADEKQELIEIIEDYRNDRIPLVVPVTLMRHYVRKYDVAYLKQQTYLAPHPAELKLRNHV